MTIRIVTSTLRGRRTFVVALLFLLDDHLFFDDDLALDAAGAGHRGAEEGERAGKKVAPKKKMSQTIYFFPTTSTKPSL